MKQPVELLQDVLLASLDVDAAIGETESFLQTTCEQSRQLPVLRALFAYREYRLADLCGHLRQCMGYFTRGFRLCDGLYRDVLPYRQRFGFVFDDRDGHSVNIQPEICPDHPALRSAFQLEKRRVYRPAVGDGLLYRHFEYKQYTSLSQKTLLHLIFSMQGNETLLACLPTGAGKSLSWQYPAVAGIFGGLILVVVPTIALAMDHERTSRAVYDNVFGAQGVPMAYHSGVDGRRKKEIYDGIEAGTLPILFLSPEALLNREFRERVLDAAGNGRVSALVVDEAHLVVNWGIRFRPEFQLLPTFRNHMQARCPRGLRTILLSATYTREDVSVLRTIFRDDVFTEYRADELRPEPSYYYHACSGEAERTALVNELACQAPRPIIVYTAGPEEGEKYYRAIRDLGFENVSLFTGQTGNADRSAILAAWDANQIDIMVATSAFGMGVDKADIRTVVTAYIPETVSRFYQEVGRAGRDGYASLNYFLPCDEYRSLDWKYVASMTKGTVITVQKLVERWRELLAKATRESPDAVWVDANVPPERLRHKITGRRSANWNKDVVLMLFRAGLVDILDAQILSPADCKLLLHLKDIRMLEDPEALELHLADHRKAERARIDQGIAGVRQLMKSPANGCYSRVLTEEFPYAQELCSGCPYCRKNGLAPFRSEGSIAIRSDKKRIAPNALPVITRDPLSVFLATSRSLLLSTPRPLTEPELCACVEQLVKTGVTLLVSAAPLPTEPLLKALSYYENHRYIILTPEEALQVGLEWLGGVCALFYCEDGETNQRLYEFSLKYMWADSRNKVIHIAPDSLYIEAEGKPLGDLTEHSLDGGQIIRKAVNL